MFEKQSVTQIIHSLITLQLLQSQDWARPEPGAQAVRSPIGVTGLSTRTITCRLPGNKSRKLGRKEISWDSN